MENKEIDKSRRPTDTKSFKDFAIRQGNSLNRRKELPTRREKETLDYSLLV